MFDTVRYQASGYVPAETHITPANYAGLGSAVDNYPEMWKPFYLWTQPLKSNPHIKTWNILAPVIWRTIDLNKGQTIYNQPVYGNPVNFQAPEVASLKA